MFKVYDSPEDRIKLYDRRLKAANKDFDAWLPEAKKRYERYRNGLTPQQVTADGHRISVPTGTAIIDSLYSSLTAVDIDLELSNVGSGTREQAHLAEAALRQEWRVGKVMRRCEKAIKDALVVDIGWVKPAYEYAEHDEDRERTQDEIDADIRDIYAQAEAEGQAPPDSHLVAQSVPKSETLTVVDVDRIVVDYVPFENIRWDAEAKQVEDIRWLCQITKLPVDAVRENPAYVEYCEKHGWAEDLQTLAPDEQLSRDMRGSEQPDPDDDRVTTYEMWDLETATVVTYVKGAKFYLNESPNPFAIEKDIFSRSPFVPFILREDPEHVRGISDMRLIMPILAELDVYRSRLATYTDRYGPKHLAKLGAFTEAGKKALHSREIGAVVEMSEAYQTGDVDTLDLPALPAEIFGIPERLENEIREATGVNELMRGIFPDRKRTATETNQVVMASAGRQAEKRGRLQEAYISVAKKMLALMQMFYDRERIARVVDAEGPIIWEWTNEDIAIDAQLEITLTPREEKTAQQKKEDAIALANLLGPLPIVDQAQLVTYMLEEMNVPKSVIASIVKIPEEVQQDQAAELQLQSEQAATAAGQPPNYTNVPGPYSGADLAAVTNQGEIPPYAAGAGAGAAPAGEEGVAALLSA